MSNILINFLLTVTFSCQSGNMYGMTERWVQSYGKTGIEKTTPSYWKLYLLSQDWFYGEMRSYWIWTLPVVRHIFSL